jgi:signal transduction histidine kinase
MRDGVAPTHAYARNVGSPLAGRSRRDLTNEVLLLGIVAAVQFVGVPLAAHHESAGTTLPLGAWLLLIAGVAVLPWRHQHPVAVLAATFATTAVYVGLGYREGPIWAPLIVALAQCLITDHRRAAVVSLVAGVLYFPWQKDVLHGGSAPSWGEVLGLAAWLITLAAVIELVRVRRDQNREAARMATESLQRRAAEERVRIARDLHDAVAHRMSLINIQAGVALHLMDQPGAAPPPEQIHDALATIKASSKDALVELRSILGVLRDVDEDAPRAPSPSLGRIDELVEQASLSGVHVDLTVDGDLRDLPLNVDLAAYRILQESLTNVARHAEGAQAHVAIRADAATLSLDVVDDGPVAAEGVRVGAMPSGGNGIVGMRERAASVGGALQAEPRPMRGFAVHAELPIERS